MLDHADCIRVLPGNINHPKYRDIFCALKYLDHDVSNDLSGDLSQVGVKIFDISKYRAERFLSSIPPGMGIPRIFFHFSTLNEKLPCINCRNRIEYEVVFGVPVSYRVRSFVWLSASSRNRLSFDIPALILTLSIWCPNAILLQIMK